MEFPADDYAPVYWGSNGEFALLTLNRLHIVFADGSHQDHSDTDDPSYESVWSRSGVFARLYCTSKVVVFRAGCAPLMKTFKYIHQMSWVGPETLLVSEGHTMSLLQVGAEGLKTVQEIVGFDLHVCAVPAPDGTPRFVYHDGKQLLIYDYVKRTTVSLAAAVHLDRGRLPDSHIQWNRTGNLIAVRAEHRIIVYDSETGAEVLRREGCYPQWGPGHLLASLGLENQTVITDCSTQKDINIYSKPGHVMIGWCGSSFVTHESPTRLAFFNAVTHTRTVIDATYIAHYGDPDRMVIQDSAGNRFLHDGQSTKPIPRNAYTHRGNLAATWSPGLVSIIRINE